MNNKIEERMNIQKTRSQRNSSFELLRIVLIFMVILGHANMWYIGGGFQNEVEHVIKTVVEVICVPAVNAFVLISGWFGIKGNYSKVIPLLIKLLICTVPVAIMFAMSGKIQLLSLDGISNNILGGNNYWFIIDYIGLLLFAPILNVVAEIAEKEVLRAFLIAVMMLIVPMDDILRSSVLGVEGGYSLLWFIYLYLLARYMRIHGITWMERHKWTILIACFFFQTFLLYMHWIGNRYTNPLILMPAMCMIYIFKNYTFYSKAINFVASGVLMAYMLHMHPCFVNYIRVFLLNLYHAHGYFLYLCEAACLIVVLCVIAAMIENMISGLISMFLHQ